MDILKGRPPRKWMFQMLTREEYIGLLSVTVMAVGAYVMGRYATPPKVVTVTKIVTVEKKVDTSTVDDKKQRHKKVTITEIVKPDGTKEVTTVITDDTESDNKKNTTDTTDISKSETDKKEVTNSASRVTISALGGASLSFGSNPLIYGASISKPVLGPLTLGVWGLSNATGGLSIGLTF